MLQLESRMGGTADQRQDGSCFPQKSPVLQTSSKQRPFFNSSELGIPLQEWPEWIPFDESTLPAGNIPVGLYGPSR